MKLNSSGKTNGCKTTERAGINPKWAWHYRALLKLRDRLTQQQSERLMAACEPLEPHSMDLADSATDEFDHNLSVSELCVEQDALFEIEDALRRIEDGNYGRCEGTGKRIPAARLRAIPWTRFGKELAERMERDGLPA
jgi:RNA polymerase-binding transcription factor DksA